NPSSSRRHRCIRPLRHDHRQVSPIDRYRRPRPYCRTPTDLPHMTVPLRCLGNSDLEVTPIGMGCWPIAGITSIDVTEEQSLATLQAAYDAGINFFDTAYMYGYSGESERLVGRVLQPVRDRV